MGNFILVLLLAILILILLIIKLNIHPVLALFVSGMFAGIGFGYGVKNTVVTFTNGFGGTLGSIGCTIIFGSIIACGIRDSDSMKSMVNFFIKLFKGKALELTTAMASFIMSIPVFGDITQVLVAPIASLIAKRNEKSMSTMATWACLGSALTHSIVPPTPGILAVAILLGADLGLTIFWGVIVSLIGFFVTWLLLKNWVDMEWIEPRSDYVMGIEPVKTSDYNDLMIKQEGLPNVLIASMPILVPVFLIAASSFASIYLPEKNIFRIILEAIGDRNIALFIGVLITFVIGYKHRENVIANYQMLTKKKENNISKLMFNNWIKEALHVALLPLMITAMGGGFSAVIKSYPEITTLGDLIASVNFPGILVPFIIGAIMMISVGSRTTAGMTAAAIVAPMLSSLNLTPLAATLLCGAGTMIGSHVSDSGFWVATQLFNLNTKQGLKYITVIGSVCGLFVFIAIAAFNMLGFLG